MGEDVYHPAGQAAAARDARFAALTAQDMYDQIEWLHGADVVAAAR
jgi:salicylate hydroxylase